MKAVVSDGEPAACVGVGTVDGEARLEKRSVDDSAPFEAGHVLEGVVLNKGDIEVSLSDGGVEEAPGATRSFHHIIPEKQTVAVIGDDDGVLDLEVFPCTERGEAGV